MRISDKGMLALSDEWGRTFGNWRVTAEELDAAIELCKAEWERVPENITRAFRSLLNKAIENLRARRDIGKIAEVDYGNPDEKLAQAGAACCKKIKEKNFPNEKWGMQLAKEVAVIFASHKISARQVNPKASELDILKIVLSLV